MRQSSPGGRGPCSLRRARDISVIDDVVANVCEDFVTYGVGDAVLNELQALWEMKMLHCGAISGNIDHSKAPASSAGGAPGSGATPPLHDLSVPYEATSEEYATPTADTLFPPTPLQTPIQTPLPGTDAGMYNIPTGPSDYAPSPISDVRNRMAMNGVDSKTDRTSPYMPPPSPWMNQRPLGVDVYVAYVENREDPDRGAQPQPLTKVQPCIGLYSDRCTSKWGRRRPFILTGCVLICLAVIVIGFLSDIGYALGDTKEGCSVYHGARWHAVIVYVLGFWLLDFSNNTVQGPARALMADLSGRHGPSAANSILDGIRKYPRVFLRFHK